jgi:hypothetical protein
MGFLVLLLLATASTAPARDCPEVVGVTSGTGHTRDLAVADGLAVVLSGALTEVATVRTDCPVEGLTVSGDEVYVAEGDCGFSVHRLLSPCAEPWMMELRHVR